MDQLHTLTKIYRNCRDYFSKLLPKLIPIPVDLDGPRVDHLSLLPKSTRLPTQEEVGYSNDWEPYHPKDWEPYHSEAFEEWKTYPLPPNQQNKSSTLDALPHMDPAM
ncbi:unnamed protein product [Prunus armeniaca]